MDETNRVGRTDLMSRWWYRLLQVVMFICYVVPLAAFWFFTLRGAFPHRVPDEQKSLIVCEGGKTYPLSTVSPYVVVQSDGLESGDDLRARIFCRWGVSDEAGLQKALLREYHRWSNNQWVVVSQTPITVSGPTVVPKRRSTKTTPPPPSEPDFIHDKPPKGATEHMLARTLPANFSSVVAESDFAKSVQAETDAVALFGGLASSSLEDWAAPSYDYHLNVAYKTEGTWTDVAEYMIIPWLIVHLLLLAVRGAILYVAVGQFFPVGGLRGWIPF